MINIKAGAIFYSRTLFVFFFVWALGFVLICVSNANRGWTSRQKLSCKWNEQNRMNTQREWKITRKTCTYTQINARTRIATTLATNNLYRGQTLRIACAHRQMDSRRSDSNLDWVAEILHSVLSLALSFAVCVCVFFIRRLLWDKKE